MMTSSPLYQTAFRTVAALFSRAAPRLAVALLVLLAAAQEVRAQDDVSLPGAPVITRAITANLSSVAVTFTFFWRPPVNNGGGEITAYRYRKSESNSTAITKKSDPVDCDNLSANDWSDSDTYHNVGLAFSHTRSETIGDGACFRYHISAKNAAGWGREVTTDPILARPAFKCPREESQTHSLFGVCVGNRVLEGADWCKRLQTHLSPHIVALFFDRNQTYGDDRYDFSCLMNNATYNCDRKAPVVRKSDQEIFCPLNLEESIYCGALSEYNRDHRECLCQGYATEKEIIPSSVHNIRGDVTCECNVQGADANSCECPVGASYDPKRNACVNECREAGWTMTVYADGDASCLIPVQDDIKRKSYPLCNLSGTTQDAPACSEAFGEDLDFPLRTNHVSGASYVYNCPPEQSPDASRLNCACPPGSQDVGGRCADINECKTGTYQCPQDAVCLNTENGHTCDCPPGFEFNENTRQCVCSEDVSCRPELQGFLNCIASEWPVIKQNMTYCVIPIQNGDTNATDDKCWLFNTGQDPPLEDDTPCLDVFPDYDFPMTTTHSAGERYFYDCPSSKFLSADGKSCVDCPIGQRQASGGGSCVDINECTDGTHACDANASCRNTPGGYDCPCNDGFFQDWQGGTLPQCADIDECELGIHACGTTDACTNTIGGHTCACQSAGWTLTVFADLGASCRVPVQNGDSREKWPHCNLSGAAEGAPDCSEVFGEDLMFPQEDAYSEGESYVYNCPEPKIRNAAGTDCVCPPGSKDIGSTCVDINECDAGTDQCPEDAACLNTLNGHTCDCPLGHSYNGAGECVCDPDNIIFAGICSAHIPVQAACSNALWAARNLNLDGGSGLYCVIPIRDETAGAERDECSLNVAGADHVPCQEVFPDLDFPVNNTLSHAPGDRYVYKCPDPKVPSADKKSCVCPPGYDNSDGTCSVDINECETETHACGDNASCSNAPPGSHTCACNKGYAPTSLSTQNPQCAEINECVNDEDHSCGNKADCVNIPGGYSCLCASAGWKLTVFADNSKACRIPVRNGKNKQTWEQCNFTGTTYNAPNCSEVFGDPLNFPFIVDHEQGNFYAYDCPKGKIVNPDDRTSCVCPFGYRDIGDACERINVCDAGLDNCQLHAVCTDGEEGHTCECPPDRRDYGTGGCFCDQVRYDSIGVGADQRCVLKDSAARDACSSAGWNVTLVAGSNACPIPIRNIKDSIDSETCSLANGSGLVLCADIFNGLEFPLKSNHNDGDIYVHNCVEPRKQSADFKSCICPPGEYNRAGELCEDIDECAAGTHACGDNASCSNTPPGSHTCACDEGYAPTAFSPQNPQCREVNECANDDHVCGSNTACENTDGGFECVCDSPQCDGSESVLIAPPVNGMIVGRYDDSRPLTGLQNYFPLGTTVRFSTTPASGYYHSGWTDACAGQTAGAECQLVVNGKTTVGASFEDVDECATNAHNCAAEGGLCGNTVGGYTCSCGSGYYGDGVACAAGRVVSFLPSQNGTVAAASTGIVFQHGDATPSGTMLTFAAKPDRGYRFSVWFGDCDGASACEITATVDVSVGAAFTDVNECAEETHNCAADGGRCGNTVGGYTCSCGPGYSGDGFYCGEDKIVRFDAHYPRGTLFAATGAGATVHSGDAVSFQTTIIFTAQPAQGHQVLAWTGACNRTVGNSCQVVATADITVGVAGFSDIDECADSALNNCAGIGGECRNTTGSFLCAFTSACTNAAWTSDEITTSDGSRETCLIPMKDHDNNLEYNGCAPYAVDLPDFPSCSNVFGYPPVFPHSSNLLAGERYAFNCPGAKIPSRDKKSCVCPPQRPEKSDGTCTEIVSVSFPTPANGTLSAASAGTAIHNGGVAERGATVTFTAAPNDGWQVSIWTGDCADTAGKFCAVVATLTVSVGVEFSDIDECETEADNCAAVGGRCDNTEGKFICSCVSGYSGDGVTCNAHKTVSFPPVENGTIFAVGAGISLQSGATATHGTTITFTATPAHGYRLSIWFGDCAGDFACEVVATMNVSVSASFTDIDECKTGEHDCAAVGGRCNNGEGGIFSCECAPGYSGNGRICHADKTISFQPPANGTLSASDAGGPIQNGNAATHGTMINFTATPNTGYQISAWFGDCAGTTGNSCEVDATMHVSVSVTFGCASGYSSGDGFTCHADKTVSFPPPANGTLFATTSAGAAIQDGDTTTHGMTITFTAAPDDTYQISAWVGDCAGTNGNSCEVAATMNISVSVTFGCAPGYSGDGQICNADKNIEIISLSNGMILATYVEPYLSEQIAHSPVKNGEKVPHGATVRFRAIPDSGVSGSDFYVRQWTGDCDNQQRLAAPSNERALSLAEQICELPADKDLRVGAIFERAWRVSLSTPPNGTVSARIKGGDAIKPLRNAVRHETTVIYTAVPNDTFYISGWKPGRAGGCHEKYETPDIKSGDARECEAVADSVLFRTSAPEPIVAPLPCLAIPGARSATMNKCECETDGHFIFGALPSLFCAPPTMCPQGYTGSDCIRPSAPPAAARAETPEAVNEPDACRNIFGGQMRTAGNNQMVCSDVDLNDTFCIVGSQDAFPCQGLFNHIWKCNQVNRPALNPFFCGAPCEGDENASRGRHCGKNAVADDILN